ncbi:hypothetical protein ABFV80_001144 [Vandammella animalimorsus]
MSNLLDQKGTSKNRAIPGLSAPTLHDLKKAGSRSPFLERV